MKNLFKIFLFPFLFTGIVCTQTACKKHCETTYYETIGFGYVYDKTNNRPLKGITIEMRSSYKYMWALTHNDSVVTDKDGYYQFRFMKNLGCSPITAYTLEVINYGQMIPESHSDWEIVYPFDHDYYISILPSDFEGKKAFPLDTIKFYKPNN